MKSQKKTQAEQPAKGIWRVATEPPVCMRQSHPRHIISSPSVACIITTSFLLWQIACLFRSEPIFKQRKPDSLRNDRRCAYTLSSDLAPCAAISRPARRSRALRGDLAPCAAISRPARRSRALRGDLAPCAPPKLLQASANLN